MNYISCSKIRAAIHQAERIDIRGERFIPLLRLKAEIVKRNVSKRDFRDYLRSYAPASMYDYIDEVCNKLFDLPNEISCDEKFLITSGLC